MITQWPPFTLSIGIDVQPITDHGRAGWRIFKPDESYVVQWSAEAAARTAIKWSGKTAGLDAIIIELSQTVTTSTSIAL